MSVAIYIKMALIPRISVSTAFSLRMNARKDEGKDLKSIHR